MNDLISRQDAEKVVKDYFDRVLGLNPDICIDGILNLPSRDAKEGHWIYMDTETVHGKCSCCGFEAHYYEDDVYGYDYCPNCGARLEEENE